MGAFSCWASPQIHRNRLKTRLRAKGVTGERGACPPQRGQATKQPSRSYNMKQKTGCRAEPCGSSGPPTMRPTGRTPWAPAPPAEPQARQLYRSLFLFP
ncbi:MAG: hypothetical protein [Microvirus sp.]|nr:MAG: hypothetical protein [Microvirus sp.]